MRVLLIDIDSLRPDHLGCYGYDRATAPTIDGIAADGVRFDRCYVSDSPCLPSRTALATCRFGVNSGVVTHFGEGQWYDNPGSGHDPDDERVRSFQHLTQHGVRTASASSFTQRHMAYHFSSAFQESIQPTADTGTLAIEDAADVTAAATTWLDAHATEDDWLLHVNYWDVHHPYQGIDPYVEAVRSSGEPAPWPDEAAIEDHQQVVGPRTAGLWPSPKQFADGEYDPNYAEWPMPERYEDREDVARLVDGYNAAIRKVDDHVGRLLNRLDEAGVREETAVVVTGDHGEALGEHGIYAEHALPHSACQRVPLIISWPGVTDERGGTATDAYVYQFDLMPTICALFDLPTPNGWDAESFADALHASDFSGRDSLVCGHGIYTFGRALYRDNWVFIRLLHPGVFSYPGMFNDPSLPSDGLELLHDLDADPHATENLVTDRPDVADELRAELDAWLVEQISTGWTERRPSSTRGHDPLAAMCTQGPFLYVDPDELLAVYRDKDGFDKQRTALERSIATYRDV